MVNSLRHDTVRAGKRSSMCLAVPGEILAVDGGDDIMRTATVRFGGATKEVSLAYVPQAGPGDYVLVHVGFAISQIDEAEARRVHRYLEELAEIDATQDGNQ